MCECTTLLLIANIGTVIQHNYSTLTVTHKCFLCTNNNTYLLGLDLHGLELVGVEGGGGLLVAGAQHRGVLLEVSLRILVLMLWEEETSNNTK